MSSANLRVCGAAEISAGAERVAINAVRVRKWLVRVFCEGVGISAAWRTLAELETRDAATAWIAAHVDPIGVCSCCASVSATLRRTDRAAHVILPHERIHVTAVTLGGVALHVPESCSLAEADFLVQVACASGVGTDSAASPQGAAAAHEEGDGGNCAAEDPSGAPAPPSHRVELA